MLLTEERDFQARLDAIQRDYLQMTGESVVLWVLIMTRRFLL
jgi:hypothetical protein